MLGFDNLLWRLCLVMNTFWETADQERKDIKIFYHFITDTKLKVIKLIY